MYNNSVISMLIIALAGINGQTETSVRETSTPAQCELVDGVFKEQHWPGLWVNLIHGLNGDRRSATDTEKKLQMIPLMMACDYGVRFTWFLTLADCGIDECNLLGLNDDGHTSDCWNTLRDGLQEGGYAALKVMRALEYIHSTVGGDIGGLDEFHGNVEKIRNFLTRRSVAECSAGTRQDGRLSYYDELSKVTVLMHDYLVSKCQPEYPTLDMDTLKRYSDANKSYEFYVNKMKEHVAHVTGHLSNVGFHYDAFTKQTTFVKPQ